MFIDTNANGSNDPGEDGVPQFPLTLRERDNSLLDQGQNLTQTDANGHYEPPGELPAVQVDGARGLQHGLQDDRHHRAGRQREDADDLRRCSRRPQRPARHRPRAAESTGECSATADRRTAASSARSATTPRATRLDPQYALSEDYQPGIPGIGVDLYAAKHDPSTGDVITDPVTGEIQVETDANGAHQAGGDLHLREVGPAHGVHGEDVGRHRADRPAGPAAGR